MIFVSICILCLLFIMVIRNQPTWKIVSSKYSIEYPYHLYKDRKHSKGWFHSKVYIWKKSQENTSLIERIYFKFLKENNGGFLRIEEDEKGIYILARYYNWKVFRFPKAMYIPKSDLKLIGKKKIEGKDCWLFGFCDEQIYLAYWVEKKFCKDILHSFSKEK